MKKIIFALFFTLILSSVNAQDIAGIISSAPESVLPGLDKELRYSLVLSTDDTAHALIQNTIYENVERKAFSDDYILIQTSDVATTQIKLLPLINDSKIVCVVKTIKARASDSRVQFYTTNWNPIAVEDLLPARSLKWFIKSDVDTTNVEYKNAVAMVDMLPITFTLSKENNNIVAQFDIQNYLSKDDYRMLQPYLIEGGKTFSWDKISYK